MSGAAFESGPLLLIIGYVAVWVRLLGTPTRKGATSSFRSLSDGRPEWLAGRRFASASGSVGGWHEVTRDASYYRQCDCRLGCATYRFPANFEIAAMIPISIVRRRGRSGRWRTATGRYC